MELILHTIKVILLKIWGPFATLLEGVDSTYYKSYIAENLRTFCHTSLKNMTLDILRFEMSQRQEVMATNLKKMTLGILRFKMSQRQDVMATSLKIMTLGILKFEMSQRKEVMATSLKNRL